MVRLAIFLLFTCLGCSSGDHPIVVHPVSGTILYEGKPAVGVQVFLFPTSAPARPEIPRNPSGTTVADGQFRIGTFSSQDGAAEGGYQILLVWPPAQRETDENGEADRLYGWYDVKNSKLTVRVKAGDNVLPTIQIPHIKGPPPVSQGIPGRN
jgi:hypothetical protein